MPDEVDELILKMQHLEAQARAQREAQERAGEEKLQRARDPGLKPIAAADLLEEGRRLTEDARSRVIKARAKLNFALDQMDQAERRGYEALRADARAEAHRQMAEDPLFKGTPPASTPTPTSTPTPSATSTPTAPPRKTLGRRRPKGS